jgi:flagellar biosynthesis protein FlhB
MAEEFEGHGEKTEEPTQHRIDEFRKRGEVASSKELNSVLILAASILTIGISTVFLFEEMVKFVEWIYTLDFQISFTEKKLKILAEKTAMTMLICAGPIFLVVFFISILSNLLQFGLLWAPEVLEFKIERLNPVEGLKRLFSTRSLVEAVKGIFKFTIILTIVYYFMRNELHTFNGFFQVEVLKSFLIGKSLILKLSFYSVLGMVAVAILDFGYQKWTYLNRLKQTKDQAKREQKEQDGNPEIKQRIRAIQRDASNRRMIQEIPKADVIVTNPTHISVALKYDPESMISPQVIAKGADFMAMKIREVAKAHNIPMVENVPLARTLYKTVKVGSSIPRNLYKAIAEVLAFVYKIKKKKKLMGVK